MSKRHFFSGLDKVAILDPDHIIKMIDREIEPTRNPGIPENPPQNPGIPENPKGFFDMLLEWIRRFLNSLPLILCVAFFNASYGQNSINNIKPSINSEWIEIDGKFYKVPEVSNDPKDVVKASGFSDMFTVIKQIMSLVGINDDSKEVSKVRAKLLNVKYVKKSLRQYRAIQSLCDDSKLDKMACDFYKSQLLYLDQLEALYQLQIKSNLDLPQ